MKQNYLKVILMLLFTFPLFMYAQNEGTLIKTEWVNQYNDVILPKKVHDSLTEYCGYGDRRFTQIIEALLQMGKDEINTVNEINTSSDKSEEPVENKFITLYHNNNIGENIAVESIERLSINGNIKGGKSDFEIFVRLFFVIKERKYLYEMYAKDQDSENFQRTITITSSEVLDNPIFKETQQNLKIETKEDKNAVQVFHRDLIEYLRSLGFEVSFYLPKYIADPCTEYGDDPYSGCTKLKITEKKLSEIIIEKVDNKEDNIDKIFDDQMKQFLKNNE